VPFNGTYTVGRGAGVSARSHWAGVVLRWQRSMR
jgi:hypothetical protein